MKRILITILCFFSLSVFAQTKITATLVRNNAADNYPVTYDSLQRGGMHVYSSIIERDAIPTGLRKKGMFAAVDTVIYQLNSGLTNADWKIFTSRTTDTNTLAKKIGYFLVMGQSNIVGGAMDGNAGNTVSDARLKIWYPAENRYAPLVIGTPQVESAFGTSPTVYLYLGKLLLETGKYSEIRFVYSAEGAQPINTWYDGTTRGRLLDSAINRSNAANVPLYDGFIWGQGEAGIAGVALGADPYLAYTNAWFGMRNILKLYSWFNDRVPTVVIGMPKKEGDANLGLIIPFDKLLQTFEHKHNWVGYANTDSSEVNPTNTIHFNAAGLLNNAKNVKTALEALPSQYAMIDLPNKSLQVNGQTLKSGSYFESRENIPWDFRLHNGPAFYLSKSKTVFGYNSARNAPGSNQVFGDENMPNNTLSGNGVLGSNVLYSAIAVAATAAIGSNVFYKMLIGALNTGAGINAGYDFIYGDQNALYGYNAGVGITNGNYNTIVGSFIFNPNTTINSAVVLADGRGRARLYGNDDLDLGIGTTSPTQKLDIAGNIRVRNLATGLAAPVTTGLTKMVITDANGVQSFTDMPSGGNTDTTKIPLSGTLAGKPLTNSVRFDDSINEFSSTSILGANGIGSFRDTIANSNGIGSFLTTFLNNSISYSDLYSKVSDTTSSNLYVGSNEGLSQRSYVELIARRKVEGINKQVSISISTENIKENKMVLRDDFGKGLVGAANYAANYDNQTYTQKRYVDSLVAAGAGGSGSNIDSNTIWRVGGNTVQFPSPINFSKLGSKDNQGVEIIQNNIGAIKLIGGQTLYADGAGTYYNSGLVHNFKGSAGVDGFFRVTGDLRAQTLELTNNQNTITTAIDKIFIQSKDGIRFYTNSGGVLAAEITIDKDFKSNGKLFASSLETGLLAPITTGSTKMLVSDALGLVSFKDEPTSPIDTTTTFDNYLDSTGQSNTRVLYAKNKKIASDGSFLFDEVNKKMVINSPNISIDGPATKLYVAGIATVAGTIQVKGTNNTTFSILKGMANGFATPFFDISAGIAGTTMKMGPNNDPNGFSNLTIEALYDVTLTTGLYRKFIVNSNYAMDLNANSGGPNNDEAFLVKTNNGKRLSISTVGAARLWSYGTGARTGGPATYNLQVDALGNIIEGPGAKYQQTAIPFANASGILIGDSTKLTFGSEYINIAPTSSTGISGITMNQGRTEINGQFSGMYFNIGSGKAGGGVYDASKGYTFQNRGNTMLSITTSAISGGVNTAAFTANVTATGTVTSTQPMKSGGYTVATLPAGAIGQFTYVTDSPTDMPTYLSAVTTGGGTGVVPVFRNATGWVYH